MTTSPRTCPGGTGTYAGYLANADGFEVELVAGTPAGTPPVTP